MLPQLTGMERLHMVVDAQMTRLSREAVDAIVSAQKEPDWLRARRHEAWQIYESMPEPRQTDEEWRRTDLRWLNWDSLARPLPTTTTANDLPSSVPVTALNPSIVILTNGTSTHVAHVSPEARATPVVVMDLAEAARERPDSVRELLGTKAVTADRGKFQALNAAFWSGGVFVHIPHGATLAQPILVIGCGASGTAQPRSLVTLDDSAQATVVEWWAHEASSKIVNGTTEIFVGTGASLTYAHVTGSAPTTRSVISQRALVGRDATLTTTNVTTGGEFHKAAIGTAITEPGADVVMNGAYRISGSCFVDHHTTQEHQATDGKSDLLYSGVLDGNARSVYAGTIAVAPEAQRSNAYQKNRNLLLHSGTRADSIPRLEIMADDVRCTHGATTSTLDQDHLYYLRSRGLTTAQAQSMIVEGYFESVLERVPHSGVRDVLRDLLLKQGATRRTDA